MTTAIYASLFAFLMIGLSFNVIKIRRKYKISVGDGDNKELELAMAAQLNAVEYIPVTLLLLFSLEYNHANLWLVHALGSLFLVGRLIHARNLLLGKLKGRVLGMKITIYTILVLAILNIAYLPYTTLWA